MRDRFCWAEGVVAQDRFYCNPVSFVSLLLNISLPLVLRSSFPFSRHCMFFCLSLYISVSPLSFSHLLTLFILIYSSQCLFPLAISTFSYLSFQANLGSLSPVHQTCSDDGLINTHFLFHRHLYAIANSDRIKNGQMRTFIAERTADFAATLAKNIYGNVDPTAC